MKVKSDSSGSLALTRVFAVAERCSGRSGAILPPFCTRHLIAVSLGAALLTACNPNPPATAPNPSRIFDTPVHLVERRTVPGQLPIPGNVVASREILISSRVGGYLLRIAAEEGQEVGADQVLAEIDPTQVESAIAQSEATLKAAQATVNDAQRDIARQQFLREKGMVSEAALNKAALYLEQSQAELERIRSQLHANRAERAYTRITSPIRARVVQRLRQPGDLATPGQPVLRLQSVEGIQFEADVPANVVGALSLGQRLEVRLDGRESILEGTVTHLIATADPVTRTVKIKLSLPSNDRILPGMFGRVLVPQGNQIIVFIPAEALVERLSIGGIFAIDAQDTVHFVSVSTGKSFDGKREVLAGLTGGERIVAAPPAGMRDGDRVAHGKE